MNFGMAEGGGGEAQGERQRAPWKTAVGVLAVVAVTAFLKWSASVALPVVYALMIMALLHPLKVWLGRRMPKIVAVALCVLVFIGGAVAFGAALASSADGVEDGLEPYEGRLDDLYQQGKNLLPISGSDNGGPPSAWIEKALGFAASGAFTFAGGFVLVVAFVGLGLSEAETLAARLRDEARSGRALRTASRIARNIRQYLFARTIVGAATGVLVGLSTWALGLQLAFVWGLSTFLLNYIPTLGSIVAVVPPALFAFVQFEEPTRAAFTLGIVGGVQVIMGTYVDPLVEGRFVSLSAFVVLLSVVFWGWLWGIPGSFVGVPMTLALVLWADEYDTQRWLYDLTAGKHV